VSSAKDAERRARRGKRRDRGGKDVEGVTSAAEDAKRDKGRQEAGAGWEDVEGVESAAEDVKGVEVASGSRRGMRENVEGVERDNGEEMEAGRRGQVDAP
jgi:hypothetical protein